MKHLLIYEKFESVLLSKTINYLESKIGKRQSKKFIDILNNTLNIFDFPISKLEDSDFLYLNKNKALNVFKKKDNLNIDYLKFWFSIDKGYIITTGTGMQRFDEDNNRNVITDSYVLSDLKNTIHTGIVEPVLDYDKLENLDKVVISIRNQFIIGTIFLNNDHIYVIQDVADGATPDSGNWREYGRSSWVIANKGYEKFIGNDDHSYLHLYEENDKPLQIKTIDLDDNNKDPYAYNLRYMNGILSPRYNIEDDIKNADFALVLSIEKLIKKGLSIKDIRDKRLDSKKDALGLMNDDLIRKINLNRYAKIIFDKFGLSTNNIELNNLQKIIVKLLLKDLSFYVIISNVDFSKINSISNRIYDILTDETKEDIKYNVEKIFSIYEKINNDYNRKYKIYKENINFIKKYASDNNLTNLTKIIEIFDEISIKIYNSVDSDRINNLYDLNTYYYKLTTIDRMFQDYVKISSFKNLFRELMNNNEIEYQLRLIKDSSLSSLINPIMAIKKHVDKTF